MNTAQINNLVQKLHENAILQGNVTIDGKKFTLKFNGLNYQVFGPDGNEFSDYTNLNTRKISEAKKWLKNYLTS